MTYDFTKIIQGKPRLESEGFGTVTKLSCICETNNKGYTVECVWKSGYHTANNPDITVSSDDWGTEAFDWDVRLYTIKQYDEERAFVIQHEGDLSKWNDSHFPIKDFETCVGIIVEPIVEHLKRIHSAITLLVTV